MGIPSFFRWLSRKYPKIISQVKEEFEVELDNPDGTKHKIPIDIRKPNPNGEEVDNLYLDMNGIVHPCSHPEDRPAPANEEEMMLAVFEYTNRVVNMARPRKLLVIAVDGVAPRAKMNQQRSRRFRSAQEAAEKDAVVAEYHEMLRSLGRDSEIPDGEKKTWDSNAITPGSPFMDLLAASLRYWVSYKISTDPGWEKIKVIISDATVPGEGEHKIMNFVRSQRSSPNHDPNTRHVIYGLDADLIMLGLATHEPHFRVLREDVFANDTKPGHCRKCNQPGHIAANCMGKPKAKPGEEEVEKPLKPFIWLHVNILREYLAIELYQAGQSFPFDLERALDDYVFMCFFCGNDFLPHLPALDIREDGIDTLIAIWRDNLNTMGGYVTKDGDIDMARAQIILSGLAKQEDAIFKRRREADLKQEEKQRRRNFHQDRGNKRQRFSGDATGFDESVIQRGAKGAIKKGEDLAPDMNALPMFAPSQAQTNHDPRYAASLTHADVVGGKAALDQANADNRSAAAVLREKLLNGNKPANGESASAVLGKRTMDMRNDAADESNTDPSTPGRSTPDSAINKGSSGALGGNSQQETGAPEDSVKLWEPGYQDRYYEQKFHISSDNVEFRHQVARAYMEGLQWTLKYYMQSCQSWTWYYPYHYAPFAADFVDIDKQVITFELGSPFRPYEQLMGVMPPASRHTIPEAFHPLMLEEDSSIKEFYPLDFDIDLNGKKFAWQGVALLPFIDEKRLLDAMATRYPLLNDAERKRNEFGKDALIFSVKHPLYPSVLAKFFGKKSDTGRLKLKVEESEGLSGKVSKNEDFMPNSSLETPLQGGSEEFADLEDNGATSVFYDMPVMTTIHKSMLLPHVKFGPPVLTEKDVWATRNQSQKSGRSHGGVRLSENGDRSDGRAINYAPQNGRENDNHSNGHGGQRGGYSNHSNGYDGQRGGYNNHSSGYNGQRGGYSNHSGGYGGQRGGYGDGGRGGHQQYYQPQQAQSYGYGGPQYNSQSYPAQPAAGYGSNQYPPAQRGGYGQRQHDNRGQGQHPYEARPQEYNTPYGSGYGQVNYQGGAYPQQGRSYNNGHRGGYGGGRY